MGCNQVKPVAAIISEHGNEQDHGHPAQPDPSTAIRLAWFDTSMRDFEIVTLESLLKKKKKKKNIKGQSVVVTIGRSSKSEIIVSHKSVSGMHCRLEVEGNDLSVVDLSGRGTSLLTLGGKIETLQKKKLNNSAIDDEISASDTGALPYAGALRIVSSHNRIMIGN